MVYAWYGQHGTVNMVLEYGTVNVVLQHGVVWYGRALVPFYRIILPTFNMFTYKRENLGDHIDYGQRMTVCVDTVIVQYESECHTTAQHGAARRGTPLHATARHRTARHRTARHGANGGQPNGKWVG